MVQVEEAQSYHPGGMDAVERAKNMLFSQWMFPLSFDPNLDLLVSKTHAEVLQQSRTHALEVMRKYQGMDGPGIGLWAQRTDTFKVLSFVKEMLKANPDVLWTGYRILGSTGEGVARLPHWTLQLFAKHPESDTEVYCKHNAPFG